MGLVTSVEWLFKGNGNKASIESLRDSASATGLSTPAMWSIKGRNPFRSALAQYTCISAVKSGLLRQAHFLMQIFTAGLLSHMTNTLWPLVVSSV
ncbi:MAG: hypothetical protein GY938_16460 [Ketobacter sp.]|nr:hypothetical protein [Ketobacter sp.]